MRISKLFYLSSLVGLLALSSVVHAEDRVPVRHKIRVKEMTSGRVVTIPANRGYQLLVTGQANDKSILHLFDPSGLQLQGEFQVSEDAMPAGIKTEITAALKASKGAEMKTPGCCDVSDPKPEGEKKDPPEPLHATRGPAIAPGTSIVYADDVNSGESLAAKANPSVMPPLEGQFQEPIGLSPVSPPSKRRRPAVVADNKPPRRVSRRPSAVDRDDPPAPQPSRRPAPKPAPAPEEDDQAQPSTPPSGGMCSAYRAFRNKGVPDAPLRQALLFHERAIKSGKIQRDSHILAIGDYSQNSSEKRFYLLNLKTGSLSREKVSHGGGKNRRGINMGDPDHDGHLDKCGSTSGTNLTRAGFFRIGDFYYKNGGRNHWPNLTTKPARNGVRLHGLSPGSNEGALRDGVVMHEADYNHGGSTRMGRSFGCPAFVPGRGGPLIRQMVADESLYYSYAPQCREQMAPVMKQVGGWENFCR